MVTTDPEAKRERLEQRADQTAEVAAAAPAPLPVVGTIPVDADERRAGGLTPLTLLITIFLAYLLFKIQVVVILLIAGIILATAIGGPVEFLHRRLAIARGLAILLIYLVILAGMGLLGWLLAPPVVREGTAFAREAPGLIADWRGQLTMHPNGFVRDIASRVFQAVESTGLAIFPASVALNIVQGLGGSLVTLFTLFLIAFYWITERTVIKRAVVGLFRPSQHGRTATLWNEVEAKLGAWIRGQLLLMAVIGSLATIAYGLMGLPFWLILGVIAGLTEAIPNVGPILGAIPAVLMALTVSWKWALAVVAFVTVLQLLENAVLVPRIMKGAVGLTPLTTILAILAGAEFRGVVGALLAVPVAGALQVILGDLVREKQEREAAEEEEQRFGYRLRRAFQRRRAPAAPGD